MKLFELLGCKKEDRFVPCATLAESINQALFSAWFDGTRESGKNHFLTTELEDEAVSKSLDRLEKLGCRTKVIPLNENGQLTKELLEQHIGPRTCMLTISWANPLTGVIHPIQEIAELCKEKGVLLHVDAEAVIGKISFRLQDYPIQYVSSSCGLIIKEKTPFTPLVFGNGDLKVCFDEMVDKIHHFEHICTETARLRDIFEELISEKGEIHFQKAERLTNISVFSFSGIFADSLVHQLKKKGVLCRAAGKYAISYILTHQTTEEQVERDVAMIFKMADFTMQGRQQRVCIGALSDLELHLLIDETNGIITHAKFQATGSPLLVTAAEITCGILIGKNHGQARRINADLLDKYLSLPKEGYVILNLLLAAIDMAVEQCSDIPYTEIHESPPSDLFESQGIFPGYETMSELKKMDVIEQIIEKEIRPYVELDAGGVEVLDLKGNELTIVYSGSCTTCYSSTGSTLNAIQQILRAKVHPELVVIPRL